MQYGELAFLDARKIAEKIATAAQAVGLPESKAEACPLISKTVGSSDATPGEEAAPKHELGIGSHILRSNDDQFLLS